MARSFLIITGAGYLVILGIVFLIIVVAVLYALVQRNAKKQATQGPQVEEKVRAASVAGLFGGETA